ncbi:uncharacterized protein Asalp_44350 [Aeromonas salmonicida subsp. pectinolytica 34mel]|uniref:Uncharacterized protein n=1 Tax=Aeromonas salmonicida subsp. pectinolytica 34mel TaxID=1324960 RepID=A0A2D1QM74_AERSA|nr:hypothetical protein O23A_p3729 [Aeromonas salmonicida]ATP11498.1 uncharacterized protein Asalp_44350 [Aeromonas salmonicida subsp. pectinolytica 34mel]
MGANPGEWPPLPMQIKIINSDVGYSVPLSRMSAVGEE